MQIEALKQQKLSNENKINAPRMFPIRDWGPSRSRDPDKMPRSDKMEKWHDTNPQNISRLAKKYDGFIAIGCIIKGETSNFDLISNAITNGIMEIAIKEKKPIGNAILTCFNKNQAKERFEKGSEAANAVIVVLNNGTKKK